MIVWVEMGVGGGRGRVLKEGKGDYSMNDINLGNLNIDTSGLKESGKYLIDRVFDLFGLNPIERDAKAKAKAKLIMAKAEIDEFDLRSRAAYRMINEEKKRQLNMESIVLKALPYLNDDAKPKDVEDDWITNFFEKSRNVSDEEMQELWAKVLAGETNASGSYSKKTVNILGDIDKGDAELFVRLCGYVWCLSWPETVVWIVTDDIYNRNGINFESLTHLLSLGLVQFDNIRRFSHKLPQTTTIQYYDQSVTLAFPKERGNELDVGCVVLTRAGRQLFRVCGAKPVDGFFEYIYGKLAGQGLVPKNDT